MFVRIEIRFERKLNHNTYIHFALFDVQKQIDKQYKQTNIRPKYFYISFTQANDA